MRINPLVYLFIAAPAMLSITAGVSAQLQEPVSPAEKAVDVISSMGKYMQSVKSFRMKMTSSFVMKADNQPIDSTGKYDVSYRQPGHLAAVVTEGEASVSVYSTPKSLLIYLPATDKYMKLAATPVTQLVDSPMMKFGGPESILAQVMSDNPPMQLLRQATDIEFVDVEAIDGVECNHLKITQSTHGWDMWVQTGDIPVLRRISYDFTERYKQKYAGQDVVHSAIATLAMDKWEVDVDVADEVFVYTPGQGAEELPDPFAAQDPNDLLDKAAPEYALELLDGAEIGLAADKGKVVVLDFWATYCPPCIDAMPVLEKLTNEYADKGVAIYAINLGEEVTQVKGLLSRLGVKLNVAIDNADNISGDYKVYAIPQTVVIDKEGIVRKVHIGGIPNYEAQLRGDIEELLSKQ